MSTSPGDLDHPAAAPPCSHTVRDSTCRVDLGWGNNFGLCKTAGLDSHLPGEMGGPSAFGRRLELLELPADREQHSVTHMNDILDYSSMSALQTEKSAELRIQAEKPTGQREVAAIPEATLGNASTDNPAMLPRDQTCSTLPTTHFRRHLLQCTVPECGKAEHPTAVAAELLPARGIHKDFHHVDLLDRRQRRLRARGWMMMVGEKRVD